MVLKTYAFGFMLTLLAMVPFALWGQVGVEVSGSVEEVGERVYFFHPVQAGQTLYSIARAYQVDQSVITDANPDIELGLRAGQIIRIPAKTHAVQARETEFGLSRKYGLTVDQLRQFNPALYEDGLKIGQLIYIPGKPDREVVVPETHQVQVPPESYILKPPAPRVMYSLDERPDCVPGEYEGSLQVALLIPLFLDELEGHLPANTDSSHPENPYLDLPHNHRSFSFMPYYHGVILALDSIREQGLDVALHVYDVGQDPTQARQWIESPGIEYLDLIIGPFHRAPLEVVAAFAAQHDIPVVSPLHADKTQLLGFPNLFKITPSTDVMLDNLARHISLHHPYAHIMLVHNNQPTARPLIRDFAQTLAAEIDGMNRFVDSVDLARINGYFLEETFIGSRFTSQAVMLEAAGRGIRQRTDQAIPEAWQAVSSPLPVNITEVVLDSVQMKGLFRKMQAGRNNLLVTLIGGEAFLSNYLRELSLDTLGYDISVVGIPEWERYERIEPDYLQKLNVHLFTPDFYSYTDPHIRDFVRRYREQFYTEPLPDAIKAAQTTYFFLQSFLKFGREFYSCMHKLNYQGTHSPFGFHRSMGENHGWENRYSTLYVFRDFSRQDVARMLNAGQ